MPTTFASLPAELRQEILIYAVDTPYLEPPIRHLYPWLDMEVACLLPHHQNPSILWQLFKDSDRPPQQAFASTYNIFKILINSGNLAYKNDVVYVFRRALNPQALTTSLAKWRSCIGDAGFKKMEHARKFARDVVNDPFISEYQGLRRPFLQYAIMYAEILQEHGMNLLKFAKEHLHLTVSDRAAAYELVQELRDHWGVVDSFDKNWIDSYFNSALFT